MPDKVLRPGDLKLDKAGKFSVALIDAFINAIGRN